METITDFVSVSVTSRSSTGQSLAEIEQLCSVLFEGKSRSLEQLNAAKQLLEEAYLPDSPTKEGICALLNFFNETSSVVLKLVISERISYYVQERWQYIDRDLFDILLDFVKSILQELKLHHFVDAETSSLVTNILRIFSKMIVTFYDEFGSLDQMLQEVVSLIQSHSKPAGRDSLMLGLSMFESLLSNFLAVKQNKFRRFRHNINKFQAGRISVYDILNEVLSLLPPIDAALSVPASAEGEKPVFREQAVVLKVLKITAIGVKFNLLVNEQYSDFGEEYAAKGTIFVYNLQSKAGVAYLKKIPTALPALMQVFSQFRDSPDVHEAIIDIFSAVSGFSLHFYKDKHNLVKVRDTFSQVYRFACGVLGNEEILRLVLAHLPHELTFMISNLLSEVILADLQHMEELDRAVSLVFGLSSSLFTRKIECDYIMFTNTLKFWGKMSMLSKKADALAKYSAQLGSALNLSIQYLYALVRELDYDSPDEACEVLLKLGKSVYFAYHLDLNQLFDVSLASLLQIRTKPHSADTEYNAIYFFSLYLSLTDNLSPKYLDSTQSKSFDPVLTTKHAKLTSQTLDFLWHTLCLIKDRSGGTSDTLKILFCKVLSSLLTDWILNDKWDFQEWLVEVCSFVSQAGAHDKKLQIIQFMIKLLSSRDMVSAATFRCFTEFMTKVCFLSRIEKRPDGFCLMLGNTPLDVSLLSALYFSHFEDLNYGLGIDGALCRLYYQRLTKITCTIDNMHLNVAMRLQLDKQATEEPETHYRQLFMQIVKNLLLASQLGQVSEEATSRVRWTLNCMEGLVLGTINGAYFTDLMTVLEQLEVYACLVRLVLKVDETGVIVRLLKIMDALAMQARDLMIDSDTSRAFMASLNSILTPLAGVLKTKYSEYICKNKNDFYDQFVTPLNLVCQVASSVLTNDRAAKLRDNDAMYAAILDLLLQVDCKAVSYCLENMGQLYMFVDKFLAAQFGRLAKMNSAVVAKLLSILAIGLDLSDVIVRESVMAALYTLVCRTSVLADDPEDTVMSSSSQSAGARLARDIRGIAAFIKARLVCEALDANNMMGSSAVRLLHTMIQKKLVSSKDLVLPAEQQAQASQDMLRFLTAACQSCKASLAQFSETFEGIKDPQHQFYRQ